MTAPAGEFILLTAGPTTTVLAAVAAERTRQEQQWGQQSHPDRSLLSHRRDASSQASFWKAENAYRAKVGHISWDGILLEEVFEALAEEDPAKLRAELVQVAAVAAAWVEAIDRRQT